ncbi:hypothetical protein ALC62_10246 [Cyphomyrmex costatus]|uniref:Uncharacterized protein n=1 Tax=Cyphomyrmex costatus TaxID=456900 RepID=A0A151IED1_9HYME|nr:hypothetical protein ALC62_10246 [Cyphomyrmex costatus]
MYIKKRKIREYQTSWLDENVSKGWLAPYHQEKKTICTVCNKLIRCCKTDLIQHSQTVKHIENINLLINNDVNKLTELSHRDKVKRAEIKLATFYAGHNIAFYTADHLIPLLKDICTDPKVVQDFALGRLKRTYIVKDILAKREVEKIVDNLQCSRFHSSAIVASKASEKLPSSCENLIRSISTYILDSAKRCATLREFQKFFEVERNKLLKLSNTRWLILQKCVVRILENWNVLQNYFILAVVEDKLKSAEVLFYLTLYNTIKAYSLFSKYVLNFFVVSIKIKDLSHIAVILASFEIDDSGDTYQTYAGVLGSRSHPHSNKINNSSNISRDHVLPHFSKQRPARSTVSAGPGYDARAHQQVLHEINGKIPYSSGNGVAFQKDSLPQRPRLGADYGKESGFGFDFSGLFSIAKNILTHFLNNDLTNAFKDIMALLENLGNLFRSGKAEKDKPRSLYDETSECAYDSDCETCFRR